MTIWKSLTIGTILCLATGSAMAEPMRTRLTRDNRFPDLGRTQLSLDLRYEESEQMVMDPLNFAMLQDVDRYELAPEVRYQAFPTVSLLARVPFVSVDPDMGSSQSGLGDIDIGFAWLAYEGIFTYPFLIPHATLHLDTGSERKGLGRGETGFTLGATLGTRRWEDIIFNLDGSYTIFDDSDNVAAVALSIIWELNDKLSVHSEGRVTDEDFGPDDDTPYLILGGLSYRPYDRLHWTVYGGGGGNGEPDMTVGFRVTYGL